MGLKVYTPLSEADEGIVTETLNSAFAVHRTLGPGFKEKIYHRAFLLELDSRGIGFESEKPILVKYKTWEIPGQKVDLIVGGVVLIKAVPKIRAIHRAQALSYLRTTGLRVALILNFNARLLKHGTQRLVL
jgi:GxxExxY protein